MKEVQAITVQVKLSDGNEDKHILVHDGKQIIEFVEPTASGGGKVGTHPGNTMLVGTKEELEAEIARLKLEAKKPRRPADRMPPAPPPQREPQ